MPLKTLKVDTDETLTLEWRLHVKDYKLILDKKKCVGCEICSLACPKEAIKLEKPEKTSDEKHVKVDIDLEKCNFCGICDVLCPFGAIRVTLNGEHLVSVVEKESFPELIREITVDESKCPINCRECEDACPLGLIKILRVTTDGKVVEDINNLSDGEKAKLKVKVEIEIDKCPCCGVCEDKCPENAINVNRIFYGKMIIHEDKCPEGCKDCLEVCPTQALYLSENGKVHVNEKFCVYCGACKIVCPVKDALEVERTSINHTPVRSGVWNKTLEKLTSPIIVTKELKAKSSRKARESVEKRLGWKVGLHEQE